MEDVQPQLTRIKTTSLRDIAYEQLRNRIIQGQMPAGSQLVIDQLASQLGISRTPIREALARLEAEQLVETQRNRGTFVLGLTPRKVIELMQVREALESQAARLATTMFSNDELAALEKVFAERLEQAGPPSFETERTLQVMLHHTVARRSGNLELAKLIINYEERYFQYLCSAMRLMDLDAVMEECREHLGIVRAMQDRDVGEAGQRMAQHIRHGARRCAENLGH